MASLSLSSPRRVSVRCAVIGDDDDSTALIANHLLSRCEFGLLDISYEARANMTLDGDSKSVSCWWLPKYIRASEAHKSFFDRTVFSQPSEREIVLFVIDGAGDINKHISVIIKAVQGYRLAQEKCIFVVNGLINTTPQYEGLTMEMQNTILKNRIGSVFQDYIGDQVNCVFVEKYSPSELHRIGESDFYMPNLETMKAKNIHRILRDAIQRVPITIYQTTEEEIFEHSTVAKQQFGTCFAHATAGAIIATQKSIVGRLVANKRMLVASIIDKFKLDGAHVEEVLKEHATGRNLHFQRLGPDADNSKYGISAVREGRIVIGAFGFYSESEARTIECERWWNSFSKASVVSPNGVSIRAGHVTDYDRRSHGSHVVLITGMNTRQGYHVVKNSWGMGWGRKGYFTARFGDFPWCYFYEVYSDPKDLTMDERLLMERYQPAVVPLVDIALRVDDDAIVCAIGINGVWHGQLSGKLKSRSAVSEPIEHLVVYKENDAGMLSYIEFRAADRNGPVLIMGGSQKHRNVYHDAFLELSPSSTSHLLPIAVDYPHGRCISDIRPLRSSKLSLSKAWPISADFIIVAIHSCRVLSVADDSHNVVLQTRVVDDNSQIWRLEGRADECKIIHKHSRRALTDESENLTLKPLIAGDESQIFSMVPDGSWLQLRARRLGGKNRDRCRLCVVSDARQPAGITSFAECAIVDVQVLVTTHVLQYRRFAIIPVSS